MLGVGAQQGLGAVGVGQGQDGAEGAFTPAHAAVAAGRDDLVGPPAGRHLRGEHVLGACFLPEGVGDVVGEGAAGLGVVGEAGLEDFSPHRNAVEEQLVDAQARGHPRGRDHFLLVPDGRNEPAGAVGRQVAGDLRHRGVGR